MNTGGGFDEPASSMANINQSFQWPTEPYDIESTEARYSITSFENGFCKEGSHSKIYLPGN